MSIQIERDQILGFRLAAQRLAERASYEDLLAAAGACGVQDSPPGSAALALSARLLHIFAKLGVGDRTQAVTVAIQRGIVSVHS